MNAIATTPQQIWVPKTHIYRSSPGLAWIRKDRKFFHNLASNDQSGMSKPNYQKNTHKATKVWVQKQRPQLKDKRTHIGQQKYPQTVNLVSIKDWMSFIRHQNKDIKSYLQVPEMGILSRDNLEFIYVTGMNWPIR